MYPILVDLHRFGQRLVGHHVRHTVRYDDCNVGRSRTVPPVDVEDVLPDDPESVGRVRPATTIVLKVFDTPQNVVFPDVGAEVHADGCAVGVGDDGEAGLAGVDWECAAEGGDEVEDLVEVTETDADRRIDDESQVDLVGVA